MKQVNVKKLILPNIPYVFIALLATKVSEAVRLAPGSDASAKLLNIMTGLNTAFHSLVPSFHPIDLCVGVAAAIAIRLAVYIKGKNAKKFRKNLEYGSARWGTAEDIKPYVDPAFENNIILTQTERLTMNSRPKDPKTARNKNVLIVGGSGSGKTRFWLKPNLLQCTSKTYPTSFVVTDPKGDIVVSCGHALQKNGYQIKILNSLNFKKSMHYNPFAYIHSEKDILKLVTTLIANTKGEGKAGDDFWVKAETLLYTALIGYIHYEAPVEEQNFSTLIEFINAMEVREDDEDFKNPVDLMFDELKKRKPDHFAVRQYLRMQKEFHGKIREKYPESLKTAHDVIALKVNLARQAAVCKDFSDRVGEVEHLAYEGSRYCMLCTPSMEMEDIYQELSLAVLRALDSYEEQRATTMDAHVWMTLQCALADLKSDNARNSAHSNMVRQPRTNNSNLMEVLSNDRLWQALSRLDPRERESVLEYLEGQPIPIILEIAFHP